MNDPQEEMRREELEEQVYQSIQDDLLMKAIEEESNKKGICVFVDILNGGGFDISLLFDEPDESTCKAFALFLTLSETGNLYNAFKNKIQEILKEKDPQKTKIIKSIFEYKKEMDTNIDQPAILPRDVFRRGG